MPHLHNSLALICLLLLSATPGLSATKVETPKVQTSGQAISNQQIEADWLRQDELRIMPNGPAPARPTTVEDARGGVDGVKTGKWGFHTENEKDPWWQVDLGQPAAIGRIGLWNRCDLAERNNRIRVSLSDDGQSFRQVYEHDGTVFYGFTDQKPLVVTLGGSRARFVRLHLKGRSYFHLDEVEVFPPDGKTNIAQGRPATQSSVSEWSEAHAAPAQRPKTYATATVLERGRKLAAALGRMKVDVAAEARRLDEVEEALKGAAPASASAQRDLYLKAHWAVRRMALSNPLLDFQSILFVKRSPGIFPHVSDQHYGWWSRPGGGMFLLEGLKSSSPQIRCLTSDMPDGTFTGPDISFDGRRVLFAYCRYYPHVADMANKVDKDALPEDSFFHVFEMNLDGTGRRQLTRGRYDDFDARYLPNGQIVFLSTRKGTSIQCSKASAESTALGTCPDSYVRCGGGPHRPVAVFTLHTMDRDGKSFRPISAFENFEWTPSVAQDGRILYARWDYVDRFNGPFFSLWSTNPDGANAQLVYGNFTVRPQCVFEPRAIPGSKRLVFTATAHHSITGGSLCLLDRTRGTEEAAPLVRLTPEVRFPETEAWDSTYYVNPWPLSEEFFLVGWSDRKLPPHTIATDQRNPVNAVGLYLYDAFGNLELLHRDPAISSQFPIPVAARPKPPAVAETVRWDGPQFGQFLLQDVYRGLEGVARGSVKRLRVIAVPPKVQPTMNSPVLGVSAEDPGKFVLGEVPVEADGSAHFRVPSGVPLFFQAVNDEGLAVQTMRTLAYVLPQQTQSCIGCHEHRDLAPPVSKAPLAAMREPSRFSAPPEGAWPLRYDRLVQPVLDRACVRCHQGSGLAKAAKLDLTAANSYKNLLSFGGEDLKKLAFERDRSIPMHCTAMQSKLYKLLSAPGGHEGLRLDAQDMARLVLWMDVYAHRQGAFSPEQEEELRSLRQRWAELFVAR